jgi:hypothetical protein
MGNRGSKIARSNMKRAFSGNNDRSTVSLRRWGERGFRRQEDSIVVCSWCCATHRVGTLRFAPDASAGEIVHSWVDGQLLIKLAPAAFARKRASARQAGLVHARGERSEPRRELETTREPIPRSGIRSPVWTTFAAGSSTVRHKSSNLRRLAVRDDFRNWLIRAA